MRRWLLACAALVLSCGPKDSPTSQEGCQASSKCKSHGLCTFDINTSRCVVGTDADCRASTLCAKDLMCKKIGDTCGKE
jgi:hypothetical protein